MSGGTRDAKRPLARPLDGGVRRHAAGASDLLGVATRIVAQLRIHGGCLEVCASWSGHHLDFSD